jgi:hypothetical protein
MTTIGFTKIIDPLEDDNPNLVSYAKSNNIALFSRLQTDKLYNLYTRDSVISAVVEFVLREVFGGDIDIVWDPRTPFLKEKKKSQQKWMAFMRKAITFYYMFGMIPYKVVLNNKDNTSEPIIPDYKTGSFGMKVSKKKFGIPKPVFVTKTNSRNKQNGNGGSSYSKEDYQVFLPPDRFITISDLTLPSPITRLIGPYYNLMNAIDYEILHLHKISHPTVFFTKEVNKINWGEITQDQAAKPEEENALEIVKRYIDARDYEEICKVSGNDMDKQEARDYIRKVNSNNPDMDRVDSRTTRIIPLPSGRIPVFEPNNHYDFKIQERKTEYKKLVCSEIGIEYSMVFSQEMAYVGQIEQLNKGKLSRIVYNLRTYIDLLFKEVYTSAFPEEEGMSFEQIKEVSSSPPKKGREKDTKSDESIKKDIKYIPQGEVEEITLTPEIPLFLPYVDWKSSKNTEEAEKIDPNIIALFDKGIISQEYIEKYVQAHLPELPKKESFLETKGEGSEKTNSVNPNIKKAKLEKDEEEQKDSEGKEKESKEDEDKEKKEEGKDKKGDKEKDKKKDKKKEEKKK